MVKILGSDLGDVNHGVSVIVSLLLCRNVIENFSSDRIARCISFAI